MSVYVLELSHFCWYVGHTDTSPPERRVLEHFETPGKPAAWTRAHRPRRLVSISSGSVGHELLKTVELAAEHGVDKVRGGPWVTLELSSAQRTDLELQIAHLNGGCFACGEAGHWAKDCPSTSGGAGGAGRSTKKRPFCTRCRRAGHWSSKCYAKTSADGKALEA